MPVNGEKKQWHEQHAIIKSNLKSILVFVKYSHGKGKIFFEKTNDYTYYNMWIVSPYNFFLYI